MSTETQRASSIVVPDELSAVATRQFLNSLAAIAEARPAIVVIDCAGLHQVTSSHVNLLWQAYRQCESAGLSMKLQAASQNLIRILRLLDLDGLFSLDEASRPETYQDEITPTTDGIDIALQRFLDYLVSANVPETVMFELRTIMYEALTNIKLHSGLESGEQVALTAVAEANAITLTFVDSGPPFDPTARPDQLDFRKAAESGQTHGFGIIMIKRLASQIGYVRSDNHNNVLTIEKNWVK